MALTFNHLLSKISLTIKAGSGLTTADLDDLVVAISGISTEATFDLAITNKVTTTNSAAELELITNITKDATDEITGVSSSAIVIPQTLSGATLSFATKECGTFSATLKTEEFKVGIEYTYTVTLNDNGVEITETNIESWGDGGEDTGTANIVDIEYKSSDGKYYINSAKGLAAFRDLVNGATNTQGVTFAGFEESEFTSPNSDISAKLTRNIDLSEICNSEDGGKSWTPIGLENYMYSGTFDGDGYKLSELYINSTSQQALFAYVGKDGKVYNLGVSGSVTTTNGSSAWQIAGIVANNYGFVINCYSEVNVYGGTNVGGIAAYNQGNVVNCYNHGSVKGVTNNVGGIVGQNETGGYVGYCYSTGYIDLEATVDRRIGGVVGYNHSTTAEAPTIKGSFCIESDNTDYSIGQVETLASSGGITGNVCDAEYLSSDVFAIIINNGAHTYNNGGNNPPIPACAWVDNSNSDFPTLNFGVLPVYDDKVYDIIYNSGTYEIYSEYGLQVFAALVNGNSAPTTTDGSMLVTSGGDTHFVYDEVHADINGKLMNDIDLSEVCSETLATSWTPIGNTLNGYQGDFNGNSKLVSNLYINSASTYQGLFGSASNTATIKNLGVNGTVTSTGTSGHSYVAGVVGYSSAEITNCYSSCKITASEGSA